MKSLSFTAIIFCFSLVLSAQNRETIIENFYYPGAQIFGSDNYFQTIQYYNKDLEPYQTGPIDDTNKVATIYYLRGRCKFELTDKRGAVSDFDKAIALAPDNPSFYYYRALSNHWLRKYDEAIADYNIALEKLPEKSEYFLNRGFALYLAGKIDSACYDFSKAGEIGFKEAYKLIAKHCND